MSGTLLGLSALALGPLAALWWTLPPDIAAPDLVHCVIASVATALVYHMARFVAVFAHDILTLSVNMDGPTAYKRLVVPVVNTGLLMTAVALVRYQSPTTAIAASATLIFTVVCNLGPVTTAYKVCHRYSATYKDFTRWYTLWRDTDTYRRSMEPEPPQPRPTKPVAITPPPEIHNDHLYSVSPCNTHHLNHATAYASQVVTPDYGDLTKKPEFNYGSFDGDWGSDNDSHLSSDAPTLVAPHMRRCASNPSFASTYVPTRPQSRLRRYFHWLAPSTGHRSTETYPLLKRKLSLYTLAPRCLEAEQAACVHPYPNFRYFLNFYYNVTVDDNEQVLAVDPMFLRYGVVASTISPWWVLLDGWCSIAWTWEMVAAMWAASGLAGGIATFVSVCILQLWRQNCLWECGCSYRRVIGLQAVGHLFVGAALFAYIILR
ncbi:hypothetical protein DICA4_F07822 [Diutina catenulata]